MYDKILIGEKEVPMLAMASVDIYYKQIFNEDPLKIQMTPTDGPAAELLELYSKMGFVMAKFAELKSRKEMLKLNFESYIEWLEQFERADYLAVLGDIRMIYEGERRPSSQEKKEAAE